MKNQEKEDNKYNRKYQILALARRILVQGSPMMTMLEAVQESKRQYKTLDKYSRV